MLMSYKIKGPKPVLKMASDALSERKSKIPSFSGDHVICHVPLLTDISIAVFYCASTVQDELYS